MSDTSADKADTGTVQAALDRSSRAVTPVTLQATIERETSIMERLNGPLAEYVEQVKGFIRLLRAYVDGSYTEVPWATVAAIGGALLYLLSPFDLIPDFIPVIGQLDDLAVLALCLKLVASDVERFMAWEQSQSGGGI